MSTKVLVGTGIVLSIIAIALGVASFSQSWSENTISPVWSLLLTVVVLLMAMVVHHRKLRDRS